MNIRRCTSAAVSYLIVFAATCALAWGDDLDGGVDQPGYTPSVVASVVFGGDLVVAGRFDEAGGEAVANVARWDGSNWSVMGAGLSGQTSYVLAVSALGVVGGELYAGGDFYSTWGAAANGVARWNGAEWERMSLIVDPEFSGDVDINGIIEYDGDLYIGGNFSDGVSSFAFARWDYPGWTFLASPYSGSAGKIYDMVVHDGDLWAIGRPQSGNAILARWDGVAWTVVSQPSGAYQVETICVHEGLIHVGGIFTDIDGTGIELLARWSGTVWESCYSGWLSTGFWFYDGPEPSLVSCKVSDLVSHAGDLYACGLLDNSSAGLLFGKFRVDSVGEIAPVGGELNLRDASGVYWPVVRTLAADGGHLFMAGDFNEREDVTQPLGRVVGEVVVTSVETRIPSVNALHEPAPNPFNPLTTLTLELGAEGPCRLEIFDLRGRSLNVLVDGVLDAGLHRVRWDGRDDHGGVLPSGSYVARLNTSEGASSRMLMLAK